MLQPPALEKFFKFPLHIARQFLSLALQRLGHQLKPLPRSYGNQQVLLWDKASGRTEGASDPRGRGLAQ